MFSGNSRVEDARLSVLTDALRRRTTVTMKLSRVFLAMAVFALFITLVTPAYVVHHFIQPVPGASSSQPDWSNDFDPSVSSRFWLANFAPSIRYHSQSWRDALESIKNRWQDLSDGSKEAYLSARVPRAFNVQHAVDGDASDDDGNPLTWDDGDLKRLGAAMFAMVFLAFCSLAVYLRTLLVGGDSGKRVLAGLLAITFMTFPLVLIPALIPSLYGETNNYDDDGSALCLGAPSLGHSYGITINTGMPIIVSASAVLAAADGLVNSLYTYPSAYSPSAVVAQLRSSSVPGITNQMAVQSVCIWGFGPAYDALAFAWLVTVVFFYVNERSGPAHTGGLRVLPILSAKFWRRVADDTGLMRFCIFACVFFFGIATVSGEYFQMFTSGSGDLRVPDLSVHANYQKTTEANIYSDYTPYDRCGSVCYDDVQVCTDEEIASSAYLSSVQCVPQPENGTSLVYEERSILVSGVNRLIDLDVAVGVMFALFLGPSLLDVCGQLPARAATMVSAARALTLSTLASLAIGPFAHRALCSIVVGANGDLTTNVDNDDANAVRDAVCSGTYTVYYGTDDTVFIQYPGRKVYRLLGAVLFAWLALALSSKGQPRGRASYPSEVHVVKGDAAAMDNMDVYDADGPASDMSAVTMDIPS